MASPETDWEQSWRLARLSGLRPEHTSFLFRLLHQLLPTQERLHRTGNAANPLCKAAGCSENDDLGHSLFISEANQHVGTNLLGLLRQYQPNISLEAALRLELNVEEEIELPLVWISAATLLCVWEQRKISIRVVPHVTRSQLEAKVNILRQTRLANFTGWLEDSINYMFEQ